MGQHGIFWGRTVPLYRDLLQHFNFESPTKKDSIFYNKQGLAKQAKGELDEALKKF